MVSVIKVGVNEMVDDNFTDENFWAGAENVCDEISFDAVVGPTDGAVVGATV